MNSERLIPERLLLISSAAKNNRGLGMRYICPLEKGPSLFHWGTGRDCIDLDLNPQKDIALRGFI
jgi:hypothetical protein